MSIPPAAILGVVMLAGAVAFLYREMNRMFAEEKAKSRSPFKEKLLRPAGESLRLRVEGIRDEIMESGFVLAALMVAPCIFIMLPITRDGRWNLVIAGVAFAGCYGSAFRQWKKVKGLKNELRNCRLGFDGERYVAEKLGALTALRYRVFHDFVFDMKPGGDATNFNFDHIVIGKNGIFLVETKAIRQPNGEMPEGQESHKVVVRGDMLEFSTGFRTAKPITQAKANAERLSQWLTGTAPTPVPVRPLLILPGWYVANDRTGSVPVLNGKKVENVIPRLGRRDVWTDEEVSRFSDRIEAHCRNVEGA